MKHKLQALNCEETDGIEANPEGIKKDSNNDQCDYECQSSGGCNVKYTGPPRGGPTSGSCFPPLFGGSCTGTPPECLDCNKALDCAAERETEPGNSIDKNKDYEEGKTEKPLNGDEVCDYKCQDSGGCEVHYTGILLKSCLENNKDIKALLGEETPWDPAFRNFLEEHVMELLQNVKTATLRFSVRRRDLSMRNM